MSASPIATAADYSDAMLTARRAKNWLVRILLLVLVGQVALFFLLRYKPALLQHGTAWPRFFEYAVAVCAFAGITLSIVLALVQLLIVGIMLVGRLIGVSNVTGAFIGNLVLIVLLFPWQSLLLSPSTAAPSAEGVVNTRFEIPGVLYTWGEITHPIYGAGFHWPAITSAWWLCWARFVVWPCAAIVLLARIHTNGARGLAKALNEEDSTPAAVPTTSPATPPASRAR